MEQNNYDDWFGLSAKYGLLNKTEIIKPYDFTLSSMKVSECKNWINIILNQIEDKIQKVTQFDFYAGNKYREKFLLALEQKGILYSVRLKGMAIGEPL
ncbi:hypothetical protein OCE40_15000 [Bacillus toyonensis]|uniref:DUF6884 domain-containing protein n=1 Tax=Bacillus toyonensis TaxID=155322 RepID=UPI00103F63EA|nr:DUF6884 domain-containing protein [Bacillus toyonensis]MCU5303193.1 hypothetical protein [Bacillus toyonensis]TBX46489.1 hypothetical protein E0M44_16360 [Bacillus toyonensis]